MANGYSYNDNALIIEQSSTNEGAIYDLRGRVLNVKNIETNIRDDVMLIKDSFKFNNNLYSFIAEQPEGTEYIRTIRQSLPYGGVETVTEAVELLNWGKNTNEEDSIEPLKIPLGKYLDNGDIVTATNCANIPMPNREEGIDIKFNHPCSSFTLDKSGRIEIIRAAENQGSIRIIKWNSSGSGSYVQIPRSSFIIDIQAPGGAGARGESGSTTSEGSCGGGGGGGSFASFFVHMPIAPSIREDKIVITQEVRYILMQAGYMTTSSDTTVFKSVHSFRIFNGKDAEGTSGGGTSKAIEEIARESMENWEISILADIIGSPGKNGGSFANNQTTIQSTLQGANTHTYTDFAIVEPFIQKTFRPTREYFSNNNLPHISSGGPSFCGNGGIRTLNETKTPGPGGGGGGVVGNSTFEPQSGGNNLILVYY